jgi:two-component system OmpR family response regulator
MLNLGRGRMHRRAKTGRRSIPPDCRLGLDGTEPLATSGRMEPKHILVVEDDDDVRSVVLEMLEDGGFRASGVAGGADMRALLADGLAVGAVIIDATLPGESGRSLLDSTRALGLPAVLISGAPFEDDSADGPLPRLMKPFGRDQLLSALAAAMRDGKG